MATPVHEARLTTVVDEDALQLADGPKKSLGNKENKTNWVEKSGGLPDYIKRIAEHIKGENPSWDDGRAIASAVNTVKRWCSGGQTSEGGKSTVSAATKAKACAAVASWEAKKASSGVKASAYPERLISYEGLLLSASDVAQIRLIDEGDEFDYGAYVLALTAARRDRGRMDLATIRFDPKAHPRDMKGQFKAAIGGLKVGESVELPDGTKVSRKKNPGGKAAVAAGAKPDLLYVDEGALAVDPHDAATVALARSARSTHPDSLGGSERHTRVDKAIKADRDRAKAGSTEGGASRAGESDLRAPAGAPTKTKPGEKIGRGVSVGDTFKDANGMEHEIVGAWKGRDGWVVQSVSKGGSFKNLKGKDVVKPAGESQQKLVGDVADRIMTKHGEGGKPDGESKIPSDAFDQLHELADGDIQEADSDHPNGTAFENADNGERWDIYPEGDGLAIAYEDPEHPEHNGTTQAASWDEAKQKIQNLDYGTPSSAGDNLPDGAVPHPLDKGKYQIPGMPGSWSKENLQSGLHKQADPKTGLIPKPDAKPAGDQGSGGGDIGYGPGITDPEEAHAAVDEFMGAEIDAVVESELGVPTGQLFDEQIPDADWENAQQAINDYAPHVADILNGQFETDGFKQIDDKTIEGPDGVRWEIDGDNLGGEVVTRVSAEGGTK